MLIHTRANGFSLSHDQLMYIESRIARAIGFARDSVLRVNVTLDQTLDISGETQLRCHIETTMRQRPTLMAEATGRTLTPVVDAAADLLRTLALTQLQRHLEQQSHYLRGVAGAASAPFR